MADDLPTPGQAFDALCKQITGQGTGEIMAKIRANRAKLDACPKHLWIDLRTPEQLRVAFGQKVVCTKCGGALGLVEAGQYVRGYEAAGGNPNEVWAGWNTKE